MKQILLIFTLALLMVSCGSRKRLPSRKKVYKPRTEQPKPNVVSPVDKPSKASASLSAPEAYVATYRDIAMEEMRKFKIPASITLAQGILESASGKGRLAVQANNHFGIKCHGWKGKKIYHDDDTLQECFRKYDHAKFSFEDHSTFLTSRGRYAKLFDLRQDDYKGWAKGLRAAGYATDRKYPEKLISLIERYKLYQYDDAVLGRPSSSSTSTSTSSSTVSTSVKPQEYRVVKGDTLYSLSKRYKVSLETLKKINKLNSDDLQIGQILIIKAN